MGKIWNLLNGKKTTIAAIIFLGNQLLRVANGEPIDPAEIVASLIAILGLGHKGVKAVRNVSE